MDTLSLRLAMVGSTPSLMGRTGKQDESSWHLPHEYG